MQVCDFGLSHIKKETAVIASRMGSPQWTAPEILRALPHDESADVYSFGVVMFETMSWDEHAGRHQLPYQGVDSFQVVMGVITRMLPRPKLPENCRFPPKLQELMQSSWDETPSARPRFNVILDVLDEALELIRNQVCAARVEHSATQHGLMQQLATSRAQQDSP